MKKLITILAVVFTTSVFSQAPNLMSYQAVIRNGSNALVTSATVGMKISILQGSASGTAVYVETQTPTTNANGLATVEIGNGTIVSGSMTTINWASGLYFIKTETDPLGGTSYTVTGTSQLLSVPYSLYSKTSGSSSTDHDTSATNELQTLSQSGNNVTLSNGGGTVSVNDGDTTLWKINGSNGIFYNSGNVAIGTSNTTGYNLTVHGSQVIGGDPTPGLTFNPSISATQRGLLFQTSDQFVMGADGVASIFGMDLNAPAGSLGIKANGTVTTEKDFSVINSVNGVVLKSPNGQCWRITVNNAGALTTTAITCP
jgi:hypothetical protein